MKQPINLNKMFLNSFRRCFLKAPLLQREDWQMSSSSSLMEMGLRGQSWVKGALSSGLGPPVSLICSWHCQQWPFKQPALPGAVCFGVELLCSCMNIPSCTPTCWSFPGPCLCAFLTPQLLWLSGFGQRSLLHSAQSLCSGCV